jgi:EipB-like
MKHTWVVLGLILLVGAGSSGHAAEELLPHRASYRMSLASATRTSGLVAAKGVMFYTFGQSCDGWTVENRTHLALTYESGAYAETVWTFVSSESADGLNFRFRAQFEESGRTVERVRGHATLTGKGEAGTAWVAEPAETTIELPEGTLFPTEHMTRLIAAAERGDTALEHVVFDGTSLQNPYLVNALLGPLPRHAEQALAASAGLTPAPAWWTRLAYFPLHSREPTPEFELSAYYRADGVAGEITQQFDDFILRVRLDRLEPVAKPDC